MTQLPKRPHSGLLVRELPQKEVVDRDFEKLLKRSAYREAAPPRVGNDDAACTIRGIDVTIVNTRDSTPHFVHDRQPVWVVIWKLDDDREPIDHASISAADRKRSAHFATLLFLEQMEVRISLRKTFLDVFEQLRSRYVPGLRHLFSSTRAWCRSGQC